MKNLTLTVALTRGGARSGNVQLTIRDFDPYEAGKDERDLVFSLVDRINDYGDLVGNNAVVADRGD